MYPMLWEATGLSNHDLLEKLLELALARQMEKKNTKRIFSREGAS